MENKIPFLELISDVINKYEFTRLKQIDAIASNKLEIFLAGLPNSGKTTFLNALLGLSRKELYESTKKATKCIFKISESIYEVSQLFCIFFSAAKLREFTHATRTDRQFLFVFDYLLSSCSSSCITLLSASFPALTTSVINSFR